MPSVPMNRGLFISDEDSDLGGFSRIFMNAYLSEIQRPDGTRDVHRNPGTITRASVGIMVSIPGIFPWPEKDMLIVVDGVGKVYSMDKNYAIINITGDSLTGTLKPIFAKSSDGLTLIIANGGRMVYTDGFANTAFIGDSDAPSQVSHVVFYDQYIVAQELNSDTKQWSAVADEQDWDALDFSSAESSPDITLALIKENQQLVALGTCSIEREWNVGTISPFAIKPGGTIDTFGLGAAHTPKFAAGVLYFLDNYGKVVRLVGNQSQNVGRQIQKGLSALTNISDAYANVFDINGKLFYAITFPTDNKSWWYDIRLNEWSQAGFWRDDLYCFDAHIMDGYAYMPTWNKHFIGDRRATGSILELSANVYQDDGNELRYIQQTGRYDHGTHNRKKSRRLNIRIKRGVGNIAAEASPKLMFRHQEDGRWGDEKQLDMGLSGDTEPNLTIPYRVQRFRARSLEFSYTEDTPFVISGAEEPITVLGR